MKWANELRRIRESAGFSQQKMAELIGIPQKTWSNYESGRSSPKMDVFFALAARGYTIPGLTDGLLEGKVDREELQERHESAMALARKSSPETPVDTNWKKKADEEYRRQTSLEGRFVAEL